ncbi:glycoside hydrolase, partial [Eremomyces bilateralis CBS 781.70]
MSVVQTVSVLSALAAAVAAHGHVTGVVADGVWHQNYEPEFQYRNPVPDAIGWSVPLAQDNGFVEPSSYNNLDIACHKSAGNAKLYVPVKAGSEIQLQWNTWPESHHGPVLDYLADCAGDCTTVQKSALKFFKIDAVGLSPGKWGADELLANNNTWGVTIPSDIKPGKYVLRHEIIALHSAGQSNGAQNYPQCVNLDISGSGSATPEGVVATSLYKATDPGITVNIYQNLKDYTIPGPAPYKGGGSGGSSGGSPTPEPVTSAAPQPS